jgi:hypothetical protein
MDRDAVIEKSRQCGMVRSTFYSFLCRYLELLVSSLEQEEISPSGVKMGWSLWAFLGKPSEMLGLPVSVNSAHPWEVDIEHHGYKQHPHN